MSGQPAPSPGPRSASVGPNGPLATPTSTSVPLVNGVIGNAPPTPTQPTSTGGSVTASGNQLSQQNLNQIVIDYLAKKGYTKTEATLRAESSNMETVKADEIKPETPVAPKYFEAYTRLYLWSQDALEMYQPEIERLLWPIFVYCYLALVEKNFSKEASRFCLKYAENFRKEHEYDLRQLERHTLAEHLQQDGIAKTYMSNKYRLSLSNPAHMYLMAFLEGLNGELFGLLIRVIEDNLDLRVVDRAADDRFSFASIILRGTEGQDMPAEDEGIPGHKPGNAISSYDPNVGTALANVKLGKLQMDKDTEEDVRGDLAELDLKVPPAPGQPSLVQIHEQVNIKQEDDIEGPSRTEIPFPPSTFRDVNMEVTKIRENRDRLKIESRTGGIGTGVSVCMYTFHNTNDSICCMDISGDRRLIATGMSESYIRIWSSDGSPLGPVPEGGQPQNSQRLIGHSGPVYDVAFGPSTPYYDSANPASPVKWLLSCSGDGSIILWSLDTCQAVVKYRGHTGPVWSVKWGPYGHYFTSGGYDKLGRIWTTDKMAPVRLLAGHDKDVEVVAYHPNSAFVFTASCDRTVRMWSVTTGNAVRMFTGHISPITALCCSPDGKLLASADDTGTILIWDLGPGRLLKRMRGHGKGGIWSIDWSVDSTLLVSGGADNTVRIWDVHGPPKEATANKTGEAGKADGASGGPSALPGAVGAKKGRKDAVVTADQISAFPTKSSPVYLVKMTHTNLVLACSAFMPELSARPAPK